MEIKTMVELTREDLNSLQYPVIVETWDRITGSMSRKRRYKEEFTEQEREVISRYYRIFYNWHLVKGTPENATMSLKTLAIIKRAINFFAMNY